MALDFDALVNTALMSTPVFGEPVLYWPLRSQPGAPAFAFDAIFDRHHDVVLDEIAKSELKSAGHSTTAPVLTVRLAAFAIAPPRQGDQATIRGETFAVYDIQPDGRGCADLVLREVVP